MANKQKILIVDDDENIAELISLYLTKECFETQIVYDGESALDAVKSFDPNLIILDLMLPGMDGYQVCREVRKSHNTPIIMLSANGETFDKVLGLELGADDYLTKPFGVMELISRVKALLRRSGGMEEEKFIKVGELFIDDEKHAVYVSDKNVELTYKEYELLKYLAYNKGIVLTRDNLMDKIWSTDYEGESRTLDVHIKTLRQKLGVAGSYIRTVRNVGYYLDEEKD